MRHEQRFGHAGVRADPVAKDKSISAATSEREDTQRCVESNFGVIMSQKFYDYMVIAVSKLLSVGSILSSPVVVKDVVYVGSTDGNLYALD